MKISTLPEVFYSDLQCFTVITACYGLIFKSCLCMRNCMFFYFWMWPEIMVSRVPGDVEHQVTLFDKLTSILQWRTLHKCFKLAMACYLCTVCTNVCMYILNSALFYCVFTTPVLISVIQVLLIQTDTFYQAYSDVTWDHGVQCPQRNFTLKSSIFGILQCRLDFTVFLAYILLVK